MDFRNYVASILFEAIYSISKNKIEAATKIGKKTAVIFEYIPNGTFYFEHIKKRLIFLEHGVFLNNERVFHISDIIMSPVFQDMLKTRFYKQQGIHFRCFTSNNISKIEICWNKEFDDSLPSYWQQHIKLTELLLK